MLGSAILDVAIGMAFLFLLLSLIASAAQEVVALIIQARAANLLRGIRSMLSNDTLPSGQTYLQALYNHGLVRSLYQVPGEDYVENPFRRRLRQVTGLIRLGLRWLFGMRVPGTLWDVNDIWMPAYISSRVFALAMRDILKMHYGELLPGTPPFVPSAATGTVGVAAAAAGTAEAEVAPEAKDVDRRKPLPVVLTGRATSQTLATEALRALVTDADGDPVKLQQNLENWYNDTMDRVSGWYKRYTQSILLVIGLTLAMIFNVNSIRIVRALWVDKDARAALASEADAYMKQHQGEPGSAAATTLPGAGGQNADSSSPATVAAAPDFSAFGENLKSTINAYHGAVDQLLPVGWKQAPSMYWRVLQVEGWGAAERYLVVLLGWIVTAIALSYGAPFWFDTLNKFMVVRSTIKPQEKSQIEPSKN